MANVKSEIILDEALAAKPASNERFQKKKQKQQFILLIQFLV
ncbi:MAG: hypothetical protein WKG06_32175 [Segetibacter sp.]